MKQPDYIDVDYRVLKEDRWAPFRRWLAPKIIRLLGFAMVFLTLFAIVFTIRLLRGDFS